MTDGYIKNPSALMARNIAPVGQSVIVLDKNRCLDRILPLADVNQVPLFSTIVIVDRDTTTGRYDIPQEEFDNWNLLDILVQRGDRWWSALCTNESCCPSEGRLVVGEFEATTKKVIEFILNGYAYKFTIDASKFGIFKVSDEALTEMCMNSVNALGITPETVEAVNAGGSWAIAECRAL